MTLEPFFAANSDMKTTFLSLVLAVAPWSGKDARPACVIIKHTTPCGIALGRNAADAYARALATDRTSAIGSVIAFNTVVDRAAAEAMRDLFVEVVVAPRGGAPARAGFEGKKKHRVVGEAPIAGEPKARQCSCVPVKRASS